MTAHKTRIFVIVDPTVEHQVALVKSLLVSKLGDCEIHAFMCVYRDIDEGGQFASRRDLKHKTLIDAEIRLKALMEPFSTAGVSFTTEVIWNSKWHEAALQAIEKSDCDLVIKSSFHHGKAQRFFSKTSDYNLMRHCAHPVLYVHQSEDWKSNRLLACLDLESDDPQHTRLNGEILKNARAVADILGMELHIACAYQNVIDTDHLPLNGHGHNPLIDQLTDLYGIEAGKIHLRKGDTVRTLGRICDESEISIVVMGTLARSGIQGKLIGNTAEKMLDVVQADILTIN